MQEHAPSLGKTSTRMALLHYFRPTSDHRRETPCVVFLRHHLFTDPRVQKGMVITHITNSQKLNPMKI